MQQTRKTAGASRWPMIAALGTTGALILANGARAQKAKRDNPPVGRFIEVDGVKLHYLERGSGPPILLVHGNGVMLQDWLISGLFDELAKTNRVIAVDRPGFGHSSRPRGTRWTPERQADLFAALLKKLDAGNALAVGHSYGALVVAALALNHPERLRGIALLGGYFYPTARADVLLVAGSAIPGYGDIINRSLMPLMGEALQKRINRKIFGPAEPPKRWLREFSWAMALRPSRMRAGAADAVHMIPAARRLHARYAEITLPVAILAGTGDRLVDPAGQSERLHRDLPRSNLTLLDGIGHMIHQNAPNEVAAALRLLPA
jgi:pimeloyl-ACP methyl ester carboxylesterase